LDNEAECIETKAFEHHRANPKTYFSDIEE
jgi:hypothetical protein